MKAILIFAFVFLMMVNSQEVTTTLQDAQGLPQQQEQQTRLFKAQDKKQDKRAIYGTYNGYVGGYPAGFSGQTQSGYNPNYDSVVVPAIGYNPAFSGNVNPAINPNGFTGYNGEPWYNSGGYYGGYNNRFRSNSGYYNYNPYSTRVIGLNNNGRYNYGGYNGGYNGYRTGYNYPTSYSSGLGYTYGPGLSNSGIYT